MGYVDWYPSLYVSDATWHLTLRKWSFWKTKDQEECMCMPVCIHVFVCLSWILRICICMKQGGKHRNAVWHCIPKNVPPFYPLQHIATTGDRGRVLGTIHAGLLFLFTFLDQQVTPVPHIRCREEKGRQKEGSGQPAEISAVGSTCTVLTVCE